MRKNSFKPLKKASLASVVGLSVFTYMGTIEANDEIEENQISEEVVVEAEEVITENNAAEEVVEEADTEVENQPIEEISQEVESEVVSQESSQVETAPVVEEEIKAEQTNELDMQIENGSEAAYVTEFDVEEASLEVNTDISETEVNTSETVDVEENSNNIKENEGTDTTKAIESNVVNESVGFEESSNEVDTTVESIEQDDSEEEIETIEESLEERSSNSNNEEIDEIEKENITKKLPESKSELTPKFNILSAQRATSASMDIDPPKFISVNSDKKTYKPGEQILLTVISEDETNVDRVSATFLNDTEYGPNTLSSYKTTPDIVEGNRYEYILTIDIPERTPSTTYSLNSLYIYDGDYITMLYDYYGEELLDLEISIKGKSDIDIEPPKFISVSSDKKQYQAGEQILLTVISEDETNVDRVSATFLNDTEYGPNTLSSYKTTPDIVEGNRYEYILTIDIPERTPSTSYSLNSLYIYDGDYITMLYDYYGEELLDLVIDIGDGAPVTEPTDEFDSDEEIVDQPEQRTEPEIIEEVEQPAEPIIEDDLSQSYVNHITIIDNQTEQVVTNVSFVGQTFENRLNNVINSINDKYGTAYYIVDQIYTGSSTDYTEFLGYINTVTNDSYEILVENSSISNYPIEDRPFIPSHDLYDNHYVNDGGLMEINIIDPYGNYLLVDQTTGEYTIDGLIRSAMTNIDSDEYYYQAVDVSEGIMISSYYFGVYQIIDVYVGSKSYDSIQEELPEEIEQDFEPEVPEYEEDYEYPSFEDFPSESEEPSFEIPEIELPEMDFNEEDFELPEIDFNHDDFELPEFDFNPSFPNKEVGKVTIPEQIDLIESEETAQKDSNTSNQVEIDQVSTEGVSNETSTSTKDNAEAIEEQVISGVIAPNTKGTITLADGSTYTIESDSEGYWSITIPTSNELVSVEEVVVVFEEADSKETTDLTVTVEDIKINDASSEQETEERLPATGEANSNKGLLAATAGLLGGLLLFVTGRRKSTK